MNGYITFATGGDCFFWTFLLNFFAARNFFFFSGVSVIIADLLLLLLGRFCETLALGYELISARSSSSFNVSRSATFVNADALVDGAMDESASSS